MLRFLTAGESHGKGLVVTVEGVPSGLSVTKKDIQNELARRRLGYGRGPRMRFEADEVELLTGIRHGRSLGSPIAIVIYNSEWERKWTEEMSPEPGIPSKVLTKPRPGHADLSGMLKYGFADARDVLERASARETAARVAAGSIFKLMLRELGVEILSHVTQIGSVEAVLSELPTPADLELIDSSEVRCFKKDVEQDMVAEIKAAAKVGDSLGGAAQVLAYGVPVGLGSHVHWDRKLDGLIAQALMSIQAVKAVSIGDGVEVSYKRGSEAHDAIFWDPVSESYTRDTHRAGGIEGGISSGDLITATAWMKPLATLNRPSIETVDVVSKEQSFSFKERTDVTAVPAMGVVAEHMMAYVLAQEATRKFGGDSMAEMKRNLTSFINNLGSADSRVGEG
ncbi:chorismate synthase [Ferrithrix thermotolerans DSM 19514]|uniref:Chorismate synthase n=1 Tax=Ferrithrix thermotolerans DSM 19514 TaxID=1121881 RepID=A0A1M4T4J3_9ACTN|nr:chorismate synthase [Ferrithrix thermotolerans DSM 19514]